MIKILGSIAAATLTIAAVSTTPARAFPPTATVSPGYDRALAESRRTRGAGQPYAAPAPNYYSERPGPRTRKRDRKY